MKTKRLFKENSYLRECNARIIDKTTLEGHIAVIFDQSVFFPEGGGQPWDTGTVTLLDFYGRPKEIYKVIKVIETSGEIFNLLSGGEQIEIGVNCHLELDWERRFDNMQRHTGEHIFTGIFDREFGGTNRGFHMGDDYMTIDIALENRAMVSEITWEMVIRAETLANEAIYEDMPMIVRHFDSYKEASREPMRKPLTVEEDITLVGIGSVENDWGCVACCGTHLRSTSQVGLIKAFKLESNKGMYRIYFEAGRRALKMYQAEMETIHNLGRRLSAGTDDILSKYDAQFEKAREKSYQLSILKKEIIKRESQRIRDNINSGDHYIGIPVERFNILTLDDLTQLGRSLSPYVDKLLLLVHEPSFTIILVSDGEVNCGKLIKDNVGIYNGKGGGNETQARAIFTKKDYLETFIDLIGKLLR